MYEQPDGPIEVVIQIAWQNGYQNGRHDTGLAMLTLFVCVLAIVFALVIRRRK